MKKLISFLLVFIMTTAIMPVNIINVCAFDSTPITDPSKVSGSQFTTNSSLAAKLDNIFNGGSIPLYSSKGSGRVNAKLGSRDVKPGGQRYVDSWGCESCYSYAYAVYKYLFKDPEYARARRTAV